MEQNAIDEAAREIKSWLENAVGDMAFDMSADDVYMCYGAKYRTKIKAARRRGTVDLTDFLADEFYNDPDIISDMIGDRIYESAKNDEDRCKIARSISEFAHPALVKACKEFIERREG